MSRSIVRPDPEPDRGRPPALDELPAPPPNAAPSAAAPSSNSSAARPGTPPDAGAPCAEPLPPASCPTAPCPSAPCPSAPCPPGPGSSSTDETHTTQARELLSRLREASLRAGGTGAGLYRFERAGAPAEIVVGIGRGVPPLLDRAILGSTAGSSESAEPPSPAGTVALGGRAWRLANGERPVVLFVPGEHDRPPLPLPPPLLRSIREHWQDAPGPRPTAPPPVRPEGFDEIIGESPKLIRVLELIRKVAATNVSVLILGESGTGKELIGRALHRHSGRRGRFVSENCAALSDSLLEGELFGNEKGAYTGAIQARAGLIEEADGGTLFLDEIGEMGSELQSKLLRVLQEREVRRLGGVEPRPVDFRVVCATHRDLDAQVERGRFRADLLFRLDVVRVELPPLRERPGDIPVLVEHFLAAIAEAQDAPPRTVDADALALLESATWPGNLRELRNELERACALTNETITPDDLSPRLRHDPIAHSLTRQVREQLGNDLSRLEKVLFGSVILQVLQEAGGNKAEAARRLGIAKTNLYRRLDRYGIGLDRVAAQR